jgi:hypothetical protein
MAEFQKEIRFVVVPLAPNHPRRKTPARESLADSKRKENPMPIKRKSPPSPKRMSGRKSRKPLTNRDLAPFGGSIYGPQRSTLKRAARKKPRK